MERELYRQLYRLTFDLARTSTTKHVVHPDRRIVMVWLWAALHDRPMAWACDRRNWPPPAAAMTLPSGSTLSRRRRRPEVRDLMRRVEAALIRRLGGRRVLAMIDAKPMPVGSASRDRQATPGHAGGPRLAKGYKLHLICDDRRVPLHWTVRPMNQKEAAVAPDLIARLEGRGTLLGDNAYDSNRLYDLAGRRGWQLLAPRRRDTALGHIPHSPWRRRVHQHWSPRRRRDLLRRRAAVERCFAHQTNTAFGLAPLPNWVRTLDRVRDWVQAKIVIHLMYLWIKRTQMQ